MLKATLAVPFIPAPYEDEILGSWLARIKFFNGLGAWNSLLEVSGFKNTAEGALFDKLDYSEPLNNLLSHLGITYEIALRNLTTLPYWMIFSITSEENFINGTKNLPLPRNSLGKPIKSIRLLGSEKTRFESVRPRYCPECVESDVSAHGEAYWHRSHQLPNVYFCHKHYIQLRVSCYACGQIPSGRTGGLVPRLNPICRCGANRNKNTSSQMATSKLRKLIDISVQALHSSLIACERGRLVQYLKEKANIEGRYLMDFLSSHFDESLFVGHSDVTKRPQSDAVRKVVFRSQFYHATAPEFCALIAALDLKIVDTLVAARDNIISVKDSPKKPVQRKNLTIPKARKIFLDCPSKCHDGTFIYWFLMLHDKCWIEPYLPSPKPIPPLQLDRHIISRHFRLTNRTKADKNKIMLWPEGIRASLRDGDWLKSIFAHKVRPSSHSKRPCELKTARLYLLKCALDTIQKEKGRPTSISKRSVASAAGLSYEVAVALIKEHPSLASSIKEAQRDRKRRLLLWGARQLRLEGHPLSGRSIAHRAGVRDGHLLVEVIQEIMESMGQYTPLARREVRVHLAQSVD